MAVPKITVYLDLVSPFAYIAFHILRNSPTFAKCEIEYVPIFLGGLMQTCGNTPPIAVKNKDKWIDVERLRWAKYFSVPMADRVPDGFPLRTLQVQRALCALSQISPAQVAPAMEALFRSSWVDRNAKIVDPNTFGSIIGQVAGEEVAQQVVSLAECPEDPRNDISNYRDYDQVGQAHVKSLLTSNTERAFKDGAFGLPWFVCTNVNNKTEGFWGVDHIGQVADFLGLDRSHNAGFRASL
ncbi:hypothetical protein N7468_002851 [Penicillium chermesinum]|uniref:Glutathione S-transferase kappa n=1 Tax=Penicillium chermesinum TaxID=63820 RepID=A0A9W9TYU7_9EURO|nr:uncharacterized protein N7468_002851 [Penicillium chermesinum]KAJ5247868.1 hypothetical protein N7468_002851 [Penicillium chermesinum]